ncbi:MAG: hypothetical protein ACLUOI_10640 [Eisenbergiella sp.]
MKHNSNKIKLSKEELIYQAVISLFLILFLIICIVPFLYVLGMSFTSEGEMIQRNYFVIIPREPILAAYKYVLNKKFFLSMGVTVARTLLGVVAALALAVPAGYILAKQDLPYRSACMIFFIITMILNGGLIPNYMLMTRLKLLDSLIYSAGLCQYLRNPGGKAFCGGNTVGCDGFGGAGRGVGAPKACIYSAPSAETHLMCFGAVCGGYPLERMV